MRESKSVRFGMWKKKHPERSRLVSFKRPTSSKTLFSYFKALHIKRLKCWSQTLAKSVFGIAGQPGLLLSVALVSWPVERGKMVFVAAVCCWNPLDRDKHCLALLPPSIF